MTMLPCPGCSRPTPAAWFTARAECTECGLPLLTRCAGYRPYDRKPIRGHRPDPLHHEDCDRVALPGEERSAPCEEMQEREIGIEYADPRSGA